MLAVLCWWTLRGHFWKDYLVEAQPAVQLLLAGDLHGFLASSPIYAGSLVLRAPVMALAGNVTDAYRLGALVCVAPLVALALALRSSRPSTGRAVRWLAIALVVLNPIVARTVQIGHPEDVLAAALMVGGLLLALDGRGLASGLLLGVAVASKQWAIIGLPLAVAIAPGMRGRLLSGAAVAAAALLAPVIAVGPTSFVAANQGALSAPIFMNPANVWWLLGTWYERPLGGPHSLVFTPAPTELAARLSHPLIVVIPILCALVWMRRRCRRALRADDVLLLLAAVSLFRCVLDPWNIVYYHCPFLLALVAWEVRARSGPPVIALGATALVWFTFQTLPDLGGSAAQTAFYLAWSLPAVAAMGAVALGLVPAIVRGDSRAPISRPESTPGMG